MFHILVARFLLEANENIPKKCDLNDVSLHFGQDCVAHLQLGDVFDRPDVTLVPALDANAGSNGVMKRTAFEYSRPHSWDRPQRIRTGHSACACSGRKEHRWPH